MLFSTPSTWHQMRCDLLFKRASARGVKCWVWREALSYGLTHFRIAPLHTELDEGQWAFNRHDTQFDWELSRKASTLPPSKGRPRLCSSSPCLQSLLPLLMFLFRSLVLSMQCYPPPHTHTLLTAVEVFMASQDQPLCVACFAAPSIALIPRERLFTVVGHGL